jgi:hypothetical protein
MQYFLLLLLCIPSGKSPEKAVVLSAVLPGGGQFYTRQHVKGAAFLAAEGILIGLTLKEYLDMNDYDRMYRETGEESYRSMSDDAFDRMLARGFLFFGVWGFSLVDAFISAQLFGFDEIDRSIVLGGTGHGLRAGLSFRF